MRRATTRRRPTRPTTRRRRRRRRRARRRRRHADHAAARGRRRRHGQADRAAACSSKALRRAVRVRFRLSEPATVTVRVKRRGSSKVLKSKRVQAAAGTRTRDAAQQAAEEGPLHGRDPGARRVREPVEPRHEATVRCAGSVTGRTRSGSPPADAWSRRDFMRNGFASVALLCTLPAPGSLGRRRVVTSAAMRAQARSPFEPFRRDLPRIPELHAGPAHAHAATSTTSRSGGDGRDPARLRDADLRLRRRLSRADDPRAHRPRGRRPPAQRARRSSPTSTCTAATCRPAHDGHPMDVIAARRQLRVPLPQPPGRRDASGTTTTRTGARRARSTTACWRCTCSRTTSSASSTCRAATTTCRS